MNWLKYLRIGTSLVFLFKLFREWPHLYKIYGSQGIIGAPLKKSVNLTIFPTISDIYTYINGNILKVDELLFLNLFFILLILFSLLLLLGIFARWSALVIWMGHILMFNTSHLFYYGMDSFIHSLLFYCVLFPIDLSNKNKSHKSLLNTNYFRLLIQIHVCVIYFASGISKMKGQTWLDGSAIISALSQPQFYSDFNYNLILFFENNPFFSKFTCYFILLIETSYPIFIYLKSTKKYFFLIILTFHLGIGFFMGLTGFAFVMIILNIVAFYDDWYFQKTVKFLKEKFAF